jgi:hypothetical protein
MQKTSPSEPLISVILATVAGLLAAFGFYFLLKGVR